MARAMPLFALCVVSVAAVAPADEGRPDERAPGLRGVLVRRDRVTTEALASWKANGVMTVIVPLDEVTKREWGALAERVERAGLALWPWVEVARNPALADEHPEWLAAIGAHHDDWRRRFPNAPATKPGEVIKAWPWVPIGYAPALAAHRARLKALLGDLPGAWGGVFLNDLQAGPSSCGCGNDQCRWALDYGSPPTAPKAPGDDVAAQLVAELVARYPGKAVVPVWVTECQADDLPGAKPGTGLCGGVPCAKGDCWPRYVRSWNALRKATEGPIALALWPEVFQRDPAQWTPVAFGLFQNPPRGGVALAPEKTIAVVQAWEKPEAAVNVVLDRVKSSASGWVIALDPIDQSWEPRAVPVAR